MRQPIEAAARPLPREDTTPPVTKMYFAAIASSVLGNCAAGMRALLGEPCASASWRKQGGARMRAQPIMTGNGQASKIPRAAQIHSSEENLEPTTQIAERTENDPCQAFSVRSVRFVVK